MKQITENMMQESFAFNSNSIFKEIEEIKGMIRDVSNQMQDLRQTIGKSEEQNGKLPMPEPYVHPWYKNKC